MVFSAYITNMHDWHLLYCAMASPWSHVVHATTACSITKVVRSSYNLVLIVQLVLSILRWRKQLSIDLLVGADMASIVLRATGLGSLMNVLSINIIFARAGDFKMQEIEPSFAHVVGLTISFLPYMTSDSGLLQPRHVLVPGLATIASKELAQYSGCRGSSVCASEVSLKWYVLLIMLIVVEAVAVGVIAQMLLQYATRALALKPQDSSNTQANVSAMPCTRNSFTQLLDERSRATDMYDPSTEVYVRDGLRQAEAYSTRTQIETCGFVLATNMLIRYRDLPLFVAARILPVRVLDWFNITATIFVVSYTDQQVNGMPVVHVDGDTFQTHWTALKQARLKWRNVCYGD